MQNHIKEYSFRKEFEEIGFEITKLEYFLKERVDADSYNPHRIKFYIVLFVTKGNGKHDIDFQSYNYQKGSVLFIGKNQIHSWRKSNNVNGYLLLFTEKFLFNNQVKYNDISYTYPYNSMLYKPILNLKSIEYYNSFKSLVFYLFQEYNLPKTKVKEEILQNLLRTLLLKIQSHSTKEYKDVDIELKALFIRFQRLLAEKISLTRNANDYCAFLNVSYRELNTACKTLTNKTIKVFIDDVLILEAKRHLTERKSNISQTAYMLGFDEVTNFTKFFKKHTALSPKAFIDLSK